MWARQLGWLDSKPQKATESRRQQYGEGHPYSCLPDIEDVGYMATWFYDTGMAQAGQFSIMPLSWVELESYSRARRCDFSAWEFDTLMAMSRSYCSGHNIGCKQSAVPDEVPYIEDTEETRQAMRNRVLSQRDRNRKRSEN